jgi:glycosyltransferase involved in cell wall biosynthesis
MEAMASGLPVVSTKHAGIAEVIDSGKDGVLVEEFDYLRQAQEISELLSDHTKASAMGRAAAESIRNNHLVSNHIKELTEILDKHLN